MSQLHGREHLHALAWSAKFKARNKKLVRAFDLGTWGITHQDLVRQNRLNLQASLDIYNVEAEIDYHKK
jgi:hypothetical protein